MIAKSITDTCPSRVTQKRNLLTNQRAAMARHIIETPRQAGIIQSERRGARWSRLIKEREGARISGGVKAVAPWRDERAVSQGVSVSFRVDIAKRGNMLTALLWLPERGGERRQGMNGSAVVSTPSRSGRGSLTSQFFFGFLVESALLSLLSLAHPALWGSPG